MRCAVAPNIKMWTQDETSSSSSSDSSSSSSSPSSLIPRRGGSSRRRPNLTGRRQRQRQRPLDEPVYKIRGSMTKPKITQSHRSIPNPNPNRARHRRFLEEDNDSPVDLGLEEAPHQVHKEARMAGIARESQRSNQIPDVVAPPPRITANPVVGFRDVALGVASEIVTGTVSRLVSPPGSTAEPVNVRGQSIVDSLTGKIAAHVRELVCD